MSKKKILKQIERFINNHTCFLILGHTEPDGDCVASQLALCQWLKRKGKKARAYSDGPFNRLEVLPYRNQFSFNLDKYDKNSAVIMVDCSHPDRAGKLGHKLKNLPCLVIDHHSAGKSFGDIQFIHPSAPSTTLLIQEVMEYIKPPPDKEEAELLVFGFCTDTGFFRHLNEQNAGYLKQLSRLLAKHISLQSIYSKIYCSRSMGQMKQLAKLLERTEQYAEGKVIISIQKYRDYQKNPLDKKISDEFYKQMQSIKDAELIVLIKEEDDKHKLSVGLRSKGEFNVAELAALFGGGGHKQAAGFDAKGDAPRLKLEILAALKPYFLQM
jgi:phosphoesterase RecJ-like protein